MSTLKEMKRRVRIEGGVPDGHNVKQKLKSFRSALWNSYQAEWITLDKNHHRWRCLINPDKLTNDYDQKEISIEFDSELHPGDTFLWDRTGKHWIVLLAHEEEEAYFRATCRKCNYEIEGFWVWLKGPAETALIWKEKHDILYNDLNYKLSMTVVKSEESLEFFKRHQKIKFDGHNWKVAATDRYSSEGLIEVYLEEDFDNSMEDAMIIPEVKPIEKLKLDPYIVGPQVVNPYDTKLIYTVENASGGKFVVNSNKVKIVESNDNSCELEILTGKSTSFDLIYHFEEEEDVFLNVRVDSF